MFYLLKFTYHDSGRDLSVFVILDEDEYTIFCKHGGQHKLFTYHYVKYVDGKRLLYGTSCKFFAVEELGEYVTDELSDLITDESLQEDIDTWISELNIKIWLLYFTKQCKYCALNKHEPLHLRTNLGEVYVPLTPSDKDLFFEFYSGNKIPVPEVCPYHSAVLYWSYSEAVDVREELEDIHPREHIVTMYLRNNCLLTPLTEEMIRSMK